MSAENEETLVKTLRNLQTNKKTYGRETETTKQNKKQKKEKEKRSMKILIQLKLLSTQKLIYRFRGGRSMRGK